MARDLFVPVFTQLITGAAAPGVPFRVYDDLTSGNDVTDQLTAPDGVSSYTPTTDPQGFISPFRGPDGNAGPLFADTGVNYRQMLLSHTAIRRLQTADSEALQDLVGAMFNGEQGAGVTAYYDDANGKIVISASGGGGGGATTSAQIADFVEATQDVVGGMMIGGSYDDANGKFTLPSGGSGATINDGTASTGSVYSSAKTEAVVAAAVGNSSGGSGGSTIPSVNLTGSTTLAATHLGKCLQSTGSTNIVLTLPVSGQTVVFTDTPTAANGSAWSSTLWSQYNVLAQQKITNGRLQLIPPSTSPYVSPNSALATGMPALANVEILLDHYFDTDPTKQQYAAISWRTNGTTTGGDITSGYTIEWDPSSGGFNVDKHDNGVKTTLGRVTYAYTAAGARLRIRHNAGTIQVRVWTVGATEPSTWNFSTTEAGPLLDPGQLNLRPANGGSPTVAQAMSWANVSVVNLDASSVSLPADSVVELARMGTGTFSVVAAGGAQLNSPGNLVSIRVQYSGARVRVLGGNAYHLDGDLA